MSLYTAGLSTFLFDGNGLKPLDSTQSCFSQFRNTFVSLSLPTLIYVQKLTLIQLLSGLPFIYLNNFPFVILIVQLHIPFRF